MVAFSGFQCELESVVSFGLSGLSLVLYALECFGNAQQERKQNGMESLAGMGVWRGLDFA